MKVRNSLKSAKIRDKNCRVVRRRGRVYVINKKNPRLGASCEACSCAAPLTSFSTPLVSSVVRVICKTDRLQGPSHDRAIRAEA